MIFHIYTLPLNNMMTLHWQSTCINEFINIYQKHKVSLFHSMGAVTLNRKLRFSLDFTVTLVSDLGLEILF